MVEATYMHYVIANIGRKSIRYEACLEDEKFIELDYIKLNFEDYIGE